MFRHLSAAGMLLIPLGIYLYFIIRRSLKVLLKERGIWLQRGAAAAAAFLLTLPVRDIYSLGTALVLHFTVISVIVDLVCLLLKRTGCTFRRGWNIAWRSGGAAAVITLGLIGYAYLNMHRVSVTEYTVSTEKPIREEGYRLVFLSDLHFGTTMAQEKLAEYCARIEAEEPDLVVLDGDIVDESTSSEQVWQAFETLGKIQSTYGTYYIYGNHDKGKYSKDCDFTEEELSQTIQKCGIRILEDETAELNGELSLSGRADRSDARMSGSKRKNPGKLLKDTPDSAFHILAEHQPRDMEKNEKAGYDLMLSGHTHAGQLWPVGLITTLFDQDTVNYGEKRFGDMELIVSSGIAGWKYPLRTGKHCEFVVVNIEPAGKG
ncbi:MAG: metallophosphoesterase [Lachnospiraceae bacterium]|nr:metallophosphoesterase [Lachnospiraceae bacterium]